MNKSSFIALGCVPTCTRTYCRWITDSSGPRFRCSVTLVPVELGVAFLLSAEVCDLVTQVLFTDERVVESEASTLQPEELVQAMEVLFSNTLLQALHSGEVHILEEPWNTVTENNSKMTPSLL